MSKYYGTTRRGKWLTTKDLVRWSCEVASAMEYVASKHVRICSKRRHHGNCRFFLKIPYGAGISRRFSSTKYPVDGGFDCKNWRFWTVKAGGSGSEQFLYSERGGTARFVKPVLKFLNSLIMYFADPSAGGMDGDREPSRPYVFDPIRCLEFWSGHVGAIYSRDRSISGNRMEFRVVEATTGRKKVG